MSTEVERVSAPIVLSPGEERWRMAKAMASAGMLPKAYRNSPGDILLAEEFGKALGLHFTQVLTDVHVIDGRPSMSAGMMQALIRKAGHKIRITSDARSATCSIVRRDDPDFAYSVTFTLDDAKTAGLVTKENWRKYPASMLQARAVSMCARQACADVLAGVAYTPDELDDDAQALPAAVIDSDSPGETLPLDAEPLTQTRRKEDVTPVTSVGDGPADRTYDGDTSSVERGADAAADAAEEAQRQRWLGMYDRARNDQDLDGLVELGNTALAWGAEDLADMARAGWMEVRDELAGNPATEVPY